MINRAFISILLLSISGGVASAVFLMFESHISKFISAKIMVYIHTAILLTFVLPFYKILSLFDYSEYMFSNYDKVVFVDDLLTEIIYSDSNIMNYIDKVDIVWFVGVLLFIVIKCILYTRILKNITKNSFEINGDLWTNIFVHVSKKADIKTGVYLIGNSKVKQPCVIGLKKKYIIIPAGLIDKLTYDEINLVLQHEFMHIKRKDLLLKLSILLLNSLNWFNPLFYILKENLYDWIEAGCDEELTSTFTPEQKKKYVYLLFKLLENNKNNKSKPEYSIDFGSNLKTIKRRVYTIMNSNKKRSIKSKALVTAMTVCVISMSSMVAKAADEPINGTFTDNKVVTNEFDTIVIDTLSEKQFDSLSFSFDEKEIVNNIENGSLQPVVLEDASSYTILFSDGKTAVLEQTSSNVDTRHQHDWKDVYIKHHKLLSDGSCKTTIYEGVKCSICDAVYQGDLFDEQTNKICRH